MIYCFDIDGVLAKTKGNDYKNSKPIPDVIARANELYDKGNTVNIFTGRGYVSGIDWREFTERQLKKWGVKFHKLIMGKPSFDVFVDDKAMSVKEWLGVG